MKDYIKGTYWAVVSRNQLWVSCFDGRCALYDLKRQAMDNCDNQSAVRKVKLTIIE